MSVWLTILIILLVIAAIVGLVYLCWIMYRDFDVIDSMLMGFDDDNVSEKGDTYQDYLPALATFVLSMLIGVLAGTYGSILRIVYTASTFWEESKYGITFFLIALIGLFFINLILAVVCYNSHKKVIRRMLLTILYCLVGASAGAGASVLVVVVVIIALFILVLNDALSGDILDMDLSFGGGSNRESTIHVPSATGLGCDEMHRVFDDIYQGPDNKLYKHLGGTNFDPWSA